MGLTQNNFNTCIYIIIIICTVEPLLKDTLNKGHFSIRTSSVDIQDHGNTILPLKEDNLSNYIAGPKVSVI